MKGKLESLLAIVTILLGVAVVLLAAIAFSGEQISILASARFWIVLGITFGAVIGFIVIFDIVTQGHTLVGPFLTDKQGNTHFGFYLHDEPNHRHKYLIRPRGITASLGWVDDEKKDSQESN